jgi:hypothetical protein
VRVVRQRAFTWDDVGPRVLHSPRRFSILKFPRLEPPEAILSTTDEFLDFAEL